MHNLGKIIIEFNMNPLTPKRLSKTLQGHYLELRAVFSRTAAHKLPGGKGALREDALARFFQNWVQRRFEVHTNVFATTRAGNECPSELDLVIHDGESGAVWKLDADGGNSVATWEEIRLIAEIKSKLTEENFEAACKSMEKVNEFSDNEGTERPFTVLFAYELDEEFAPFLYEKFTYESSRYHPYDAVVLLEHGAYFSDKLDELRLGIERGLSIEQVRNDGPSQDRLNLKFWMDSRIPNDIVRVGDGSPESALLALAALSTYATSGHQVTHALLAACVHSNYNPIFAPDHE